MTQEIQFDIFSGAPAAPAIPAKPKPKLALVADSKPVPSSDVDVCPVTGYEQMTVTVEDQACKVTINSIITPVAFAESEPVFKAELKDQAPEHYAAFLAQLSELSAGDRFVNPVGGIDIYIGQSKTGQALYQDIRGVRFSFNESRYRKVYDNTTLRRPREARFILKGES